jgi:hypothetical protein
MSGGVKIWCSGGGTASQGRQRWRNQYGSSQASDTLRDVSHHGGWRGMWARGSSRGGARWGQRGVSVVNGSMNVSITGWSDKCLNVYQLCGARARRCSRHCPVCPGVLSTCLRVCVDTYMTDTVAAIEKYGNCAINNHRYLRAKGWPAGHSSRVAAVETNATLRPVLWKKSEGSLIDQRSTCVRVCGSSAQSDASHEEENRTHHCSVTCAQGVSLA